MSLKVDNINQSQCTQKKRISAYITLLLVVCLLTSVATSCSKGGKLTDAELYQAATKDAMTIEDGEVLPLATITPESDMTTWHDGKVLLLTINRHPERYPADQEITLGGEVWTFTDKEMLSWYSENNKDVTDWDMRFKQLIGVPPEDDYTHVTAMWVSPENIIRPAYNTDITTDTMPVTLPDDTDEEYREWFNGNIIWSYFDDAYPWTRLGYTYDWSADSDEYGLTEFLVAKDSEVNIEYTDTVNEFVVRLANLSK